MTGPYIVNHGYCTVCIWKRHSKFKDRYAELKASWTTDNPQCDLPWQQGACHQRLHCFGHEGLPYPDVEVILQELEIDHLPRPEAVRLAVHGGVIQLLDERGVDMMDDSKHSWVLVKYGCGCVIKSVPSTLYSKRPLPMFKGGDGAVTHMANWELEEAPRECDKCKPLRTLKMF